MSQTAETQKFISTKALAELVGVTHGKIMGMLLRREIDAPARLIERNRETFLFEPSCVGRVAAILASPKAPSKSALTIE